MRNFCDMPMKITFLATNLKIVSFKGFTLACSIFSLLGKLTLKTHQVSLRDVPCYLIPSHIIVVIPVVNSICAVHKYRI